MKNLEQAHAFLNNVKMPTRSEMDAFVLNYILQNKNEEVSAYKYITSQNAINDGYKMTTDEIDDLFDHLSMVTINKMGEAGVNDLEQIVNSGLVSFQDLSYYAWTDYEKVLANLDSGSFCHVYMNEYLQEPEQDVDVRFYINFDARNLPQAVKQIVNKLKQNNLPVHFKFGINNERNDNFVMYTNYNTCENLLEALREVKQENEDLFEGCQNINPLLGKIDNFIGFSEEMGEDTSFNLSRAVVLDSLLKTFTYKTKDEEILSRLYSANKEYVEQEFLKHNIDINHMPLKQESVTELKKLGPIGQQDGMER